MRNFLIELGSILEEVILNNHAISNKEKPVAKPTEKPCTYDFIY
jgi:hypothetical protein